MLSLRVVFPTMVLHESRTFVARSSLHQYKSITLCSVFLNNKELTRGTLTEVCLGWTGLHVRNQGKNICV